MDTPGFDWAKWLPVIIPSAAAGVTGYLGYRAAGNATEAQAQSARESMGLLRDIYGQNRADEAPWRAGGGYALNAMERGLGLPMTYQGDNMGGGQAGSPLNSTFTSPLLGQNPGSWGRGVGRTLAGAGAGALAGGAIGAIGGPIGLAAGAGVGATSTLFGRGRREADQIVPMQNAVSTEIDRINREVEARRQQGTLTQQDLATAGNTVQSLLQQFDSATQDYGRAGPGGRSTLHSAYDPVLQGWQGQVASLPAAQDQGGMGGAGASGAQGGQGGIPPGYFTQTFGEQFNANRDIDPSFNFVMQEGMRAIQNSAAAKGTLLSGGTGKSLERFGQGLASKEYQNAYNRFNNDRSTVFGRLGEIAGFGPAATNAGMQSANNFGNQATELTTGLGNVRAAGAMNQANAIGNAAGEIGDSLTSQILLNSIGQNRFGAPAPQYRLPYTGQDINS